MQLPKNTLDIEHKDRWDSKYHASYAEAKLVALSIDFHTKKPEALARARLWHLRRVHQLEETRRHIDALVPDWQSKK